MKLKRREPGPGQESVWNYPRPPRLEVFSGHIHIVFNGITIADTLRAKRVLETSHPPVYYIPPEDIAMEHIEKSDSTSFCEWKGLAVYHTVAVRDKRAEKAAWSYPDPRPGFREIQDHLAFYAGLMDACYVNGEQVQPQPGGFYGGWITENIVGPFKGAPGTWGW